MVRVGGPVGTTDHIVDAAKMVQFVQPPKMVPHSAPRSATPARRHLRDLPNMITSTTATAGTP